jgi:hypothetical protein
MESSICYLSTLIDCPGYWSCYVANNLPVSSANPHPIPRLNCLPDHFYIIMGIQRPAPFDFHGATNKERYNVLYYTLNRTQLRYR